MLGRCFELNKNVDKHRDLYMSCTQTHTHTHIDYTMKYGQVELSYTMREIETVE